MPRESLKVELPDQRVVTFVGRQAWALRRLHQAGNNGLTTLHEPAPRWSHYVYRLREAGLVITTTKEPHGGPFKGHHGRYRLETPLRIVDEVAA